RHKRALEPLRAAGDERLHLHRVARFDLERRRRRGVVIAPGDGLGRGLQLVSLGRGCGLGLLAFKRTRGAKQHDYGWKRQECFYKYPGLGRKRGSRPYVTRGKTIDWFVGFCNDRRRAFCSTPAAAINAPTPRASPSSRRCHRLIYNPRRIGHT